ENISLRAKTSMLEVEQTISTWPQLASSVALGGAVGADVSRRIRLGQFHQSGRYYIDLDELVADPKPAKQDQSARENPYRPLSDSEMIGIINSTPKQAHSGLADPGPENIKTFIQAASAAPSTGNDQPWKWLVRD